MSITESTNNIFNVIKAQYGESILAKIRRLERLRIRYGNCTNHLRFSLRCLHSDLLPKDLKIKCKVNTRRSREILRRASRMLLQERIHLNHNKRAHLLKGIEELDKSIGDIISKEHYETIRQIHDKTYNSSLANVKARQVKKFTNLEETNELPSIHNDSTETVDKSRWVLNLSSKQLDNDQISLLSKGMKFCITPRYIPSNDIIATVESSIKK